MISALLFSALALAGTVRVEVLDVGQGDAILIRTPAQKTILIDAGEGDVNVVDMLKDRGVGQIDLLIATHPHADHIGGMDEVVAGLPVRNFIDNGLPHTTQTYQRLMQGVEERGIPYRAAVSGTVFNLDDGAKVEILLPGATRITNTRSDLNANSVVVRLTHGNDCFLFTGDAEEPTERALLNQGIGACDVLKVAHHGSEYSSSAAFLDAVQPSIAVISVGVGNSYGHPGPETMGRLTERGATIYRTDQQGTIVLLSDGQKITVQAGGTAASTSTATTAATSSAATSSTASTSTATSSAPATSCAFLASKSSDVFHEASCGTGGRISADNRVCYLTREQAIAAGKRPAGCCNP